MLKGNLVNNSAASLGWLAFVVVTIGINGPAIAQGGANCLFQCDSQCYGQQGPYCRSGCMARCNSNQNLSGPNTRSSEAGIANACEIAVWFSDGCAALAIGSDGAWGADWAETTAEASARALKACRSEDDSGACEVVKSFCSH
jgi:Domain of unknown function (DUF4189)